MSVQFEAFNILFFIGSLCFCSSLTLSSYYFHVNPCCLHHRYTNHGPSDDLLFVGNVPSAAAAIIDFTTSVCRFTYHQFQSVVQGKKVSLPGFGTFEPRPRAARKGRNPKTGEEMEIKAFTSVGFSASKTFKDRVNLK